MVPGCGEESVAIGHQPNEEEAGDEHERRPVLSGGRSGIGRAQGEGHHQRGETDRTEDPAQSSTGAGVFDRSAARRTGALSLELPIASPLLPFPIAPHRKHIAHDRGACQMLRRSRVEDVAGGRRGEFSEVGVESGAPDAPDATATAPRQSPMASTASAEERCFVRLGVGRTEE